MNNPFSNPAFSMTALTAAINILPNRYGRLEELNLMPSKPVRQRQIVVEEMNGVLNLLPTLPPGSPGTVGVRGKRKLRSFVVPHIPHDDEVLPEQEWLLTATGTVSPEQLEASRQAWARPAPLGTGTRYPDGPFPPRRTDGFLRLSVSHTQPTVTGLRAVFRGNQWERLADALAQAQVTLQSARRLRVGRVGLRDLPPGQWRQLQRYERF